MISLVRNSSNSLLGGSRFSRFIGRTLRVRNFNKLLLAALLVGAAGTALAGTPCGTNLEYEIVGGNTLVFTTDPTQSATIYSSAFLGRTDIAEVIFPDNLIDISTSAFQGCTGLTEIVIPPSVTNIGVYAFEGCSSLVSVLCRPTTAPTLGTDAFTNCHTNLEICVPRLGGTGGYNYSDWYTSYGEKLNLCFLDEHDDEGTTESQITAFRTQSITDVFLFRTLRKAGSFNTLTLPFNVPDIESSPLTGAEVYTFSSATVENGTLQLEIEKVTSNSLTAGVPYLIQWPNTGEVLNHMYFSGITWDDNQTADDAGTGQVTYHGFYGRTHINDDTDGEQHLNLFLGGNNTLYWPNDGDNASAKMLGFRAWFQVSTGASLAPVYRGMPASLRIKSTPTDVNSVTSNPSPVTEKVLRNGQIIIIRNGEQYSITGQKL